MQIYALRMFNFERYGEESNSVVFDINPYKNDAIDFDKLYDQIKANPLEHINKVKETGLTNMIGIIGSLGDNLGRSNGSGKSTILEAICYVFYDQIIRKNVNTDKIQAAGTSVVTRFNGKIPESLKESFVECIFEEKNSIYRIKRGRTYSKSHKTNSPVVEFECIVDNSPDSQAGHRKGDTQESINSVINLDFDIFSNGIMFGQNDSGKFLIGTDKTRKEMLVNLLGLETVIQGCIEIIRTRKTALNKVVDALNVEKSLYSDLASKDIDAINLQIEEKKTSIKNFDKTIQKLQDEIKLLSNSDTIKEMDRIKIEGTKLGEEKTNQSNQKLEQVKEWQKLLDDLVNKDASFNNQIQTTTSKKNDMLSKIKSLQNAIDSFNLEECKTQLAKVEKAKKVKDQYEGESKTLSTKKDEILTLIAQEKSEMSRYTKEINFLNDQLKNAKDSDSFTCDKCKSVVQRKHVEEELANNNKLLNDHKELMESHTKAQNDHNVLVEENTKKVNIIRDLLLKESQINASIKENESNKLRIKDLNANLDEYNKAIEDLNTQKSGLITQKSEYQAKINDIGIKYDAKIQELTNQIVELKTKYTELSNSVKAIENQINSLNNDIKFHESSKTTYNLAIGSLLKEIDVINQNKSKLKDVSVKIDEKTKELNRLVLLDTLFGLDGIQIRIIKKYLPLLNVYIKEFLDILANGEMSIELYINDRQEVDMRIRGNSADTYFMLSGGEKAVARLGVSIGMALLSFSRSVNKPELICLDEIFSPLDSERENCVFTLLSKLSSKFERVIVISHKQSIDERIQNKILVEKVPGDYGYSKIKSIY